MARTYLLNGTTSQISVSVNGGDPILLDPLDFQAPTQQTAQLGLASSPNRDVLGTGENEIVVKLAGTNTIWNVVLGPEVSIALDVQLVIFANQLQPKNTVSTRGFTITRESVPGSAQRPAEDPAAEAEATVRSRCPRRPPPVRGAAAQELSFSLVASDGQGALYSGSNSSPATNGVAAVDYYLFLTGDARHDDILGDGAEPPETLTLQESWDATGAYVFLDSEVAPDTLLGELAAALSRSGTSFSRLAWRRAADQYDVVQASTASAVSVDTTFAIGGWHLVLRRNTTLSLDSAAPGIRLQRASGEDTLLVEMVRTGVAQPIGTLPQEIQLPLGGLDRGSLTLAWDWDHYRLGEDLGGDLRLFFGDNAEIASVVRYPLFTPAPDPGPRPVINLYFHVFLQPLAPLDDQRTRLAFDLEQPNEMSSHFLASTTNAPVTLTPVAPTNGGLNPGFGFAKSAGQEESDRYLCPVGELQIGASGLNGSERVQIRAGIAGTEYVLAEPGDRLCFVSSRPAFAAGYQPQGGSETTLDDRLTTSWVKVLRQDTAAADPEVVKTSYCAQPSTASYFGAAADSATAVYDYPIAVGASLVQLTGVKQDVPFPLLPYSGVFFEDQEQGITNPNPDLSAADLGALERQVVAPDRRNQLAPHFDPRYGPIFFDTSTNVAFDGGHARTPLGLLAELNTATGGVPPAGTIKRILLARSPQNPDQYLSLDADANGVVNPQLANTVLDDNLFLVATDQASIQPFSDTIQLGDFTFQADLGLPDHDRTQPAKTVMIFKFVPGVTARSLINDSDSWNLLIGDQTPEKIHQIHDFLEESLRIADEGGELFASFREMVDDPNWNGLLLFNVALKYQALPLDIQILLGGINGQLRAHHFGITVNQIDEQRSGLTLDYSSLFSVIHYQEAFQSPAELPHFQVLLLNVAYANSKLTIFDSQIAFSIKELFRSPVTLKTAPPSDFKPSGTIVIDGVYTLFEDGTGSLVFATQDLRGYVFDTGSGLRVPVAQSVTNLVLVPISQKVDGEVTLASSALNLDGLLALRNDLGGDLFSYGEVDTNTVPTKGLALAGYAFAMETRISGNQADPPTIATELTGMKVDQAMSEARAQSLEQTFPGSITALTVTDKGLSPSSTGEWQVRVADADYTAAPVYSLSFAVPLGQLGALLSERTDLTATMFVGWAPAGQDLGQDDQVGLVLRLPPEVAGPNGFQIQGILRSSFDYVQLNRFQLSPSTASDHPAVSAASDDDTFVYALLFVHYQGMLLNLLFNYSSGPKDLGLFGGPGNPGGNNSLLFVGKSVDEDWNGPTVSILFEDVPIVFLGRSYQIKTDPTDPNVIDDVFDALNPLTDKTVEQFINFIFANASLYNSDAGIAFALKLSFKSLALTAVLHDSSFYGAQITLTPEEENGNDTRSRQLAGTVAERLAAHVGERLSTGAGEPGNGSLLTGSAAVVDTPGDALAPAEEKKSFKDQIEGFTFTIIYRKVSDSVGVWSADVYLDLGQLNLGAFQLSLPNFSISIWTNGDWRFAIGWPFNGDDSHPITVQFQAGPVPVIGSCGFYLGKLSSAAAPDQFGTEFKLIWTFGVGLAAGVGKEWESGPLSAGASLMLGLGVEGFLASFSGEITDDGVDYWWWGISLSLTGNVFGKVDFKVIAVDVSLTITITMAFAIETAHSSPLLMTAEVTVDASIKIVFVKISFSFKAKLEIFSFTFGNGPVAQLSGPTPTAILAAANRRGIAAAGRREPDAELVGELRQRAAAVAARATRGRETGSAAPPATAATPERLEISFVLQPTAISADGTSWAPQGVATLVLEATSTASPFSLLAAGLARWLIDAYGGTGTFARQLEETAAALKLGLFDSQVSQALSESFVFAIGPWTMAAETAVAALPVHPSLGVEYGGGPVLPATDKASRRSFGSRRVPASYPDLIDAYFAGTPIPSALAEGDESVAGMVFDKYFVMLAQQLIQLLEETAAPDLVAALAALDLGDLGGFVSRFLMGGIRLPDPANPSELEALAVLTGQQFALRQEQDTWLLDADLVATATTPGWIEVAADTSSSLDPSMVHTSGPAAPPWTIGQLPALQPKPMIFPLNNNQSWEDADGTSHVMTRLPESVHQAIREWRRSTGSAQGPWLVQELVGGEADQDQQVDLAAGGIPWPASASLLLPIRLATIPDPSGAPGAMLADVFSLLGTDEADRAALQALLDDAAATVTAVDLLVSVSRGNWRSTRTPNVLVRADLSTSNAPAALAAKARISEALTEDSDCSNYAKPGEGGVQLRRFLRMVWEVSVVHSDGYYLQVEGLDPAIFDGGPADLMLLVRFGGAGSIVQATDYQNTLVGEKPADGKAIFSTLASDSAGSPVQGWAAGYPGGSVGWSITWPDAPTVADAASGDFLQGLYQMVSFRVEQINGTPVETSWSRPVSAQESSPEGAAEATWSYQRVFETAPVTGSDNRYADVNDTFTVRLSIEDVFGNSLPEVLLPTADLKVVYNDDLLGLGSWVGSQAAYLVKPGGGTAVQLELEVSFDPSVVQDAEGRVNPEQLASSTGLYRQLLDQLTDPDLSAAVETGGVLAAAPLTELSGGTTLLAGLVTAVRAIVAWLEAGGTGSGPAPATLVMDLDRAQPTRWAGDLQELMISLVLERTGVSDEIAKLAPAVRTVSSPIQPVEQASSSDDPTGLTTFANNLERAYFAFDGAKGVLKVATGTNSDLSSQRFGRRSIWLQRWGAEVGTAVQVLNDADNPPVFFAPPPLSTQLITREVDGLRVYMTPSDYSETTRVFSSTDMDRWASELLATVETIFAPRMAPAVADSSSAADDLYDPFVGSKESLAGSIATSVDYVYDEPPQTGDPASAKETWRQALLRTLVSGYGFSTLTQLEALVTLHGAIEPEGDPEYPPQLYGAIQGAGESAEERLPYTLTPALLPLVDGRGWLNFLVSAQDPAAQRAFTLDLDYQVNQMEHQRDSAAAACGYTPSSWLTFVLQQNPKPLPQGRDNTLTQPIGTTRMPIPLRTYPPLPKILTATTFANDPITSIGDAMTWGLELTVERSRADQDSLNLALTFNATEPTQAASPTERTLLASGRPVPDNLYSALARFVFEYPQLRPYIEQLPVKGGPDSIQAIKELSDLFAGVALTWPAWKPPTAARGRLDEAGPDTDLEVWSFEIQNVEDSVNLQVKASWSRDDDLPPWPEIGGYRKISEQGVTAVYEPTGGEPLSKLVLAWGTLFILDYQNVCPSAYTERNRNLAIPPQETNPAFIYRTETVSWPTPLVPLVNAGQLIELAPEASLQQAIERMLEQLLTPPAGSRTNGTGTVLDLETSIDYRYLVLTQKQTSLFTLLPVFLIKTDVEDGAEEQTAEVIAGNLASWQATTQAASKEASLRFLLTVFSTTIVSADDPLPLVRFPGLVIPVPTDDPAWWGSSS